LTADARDGAAWNCIEDPSGRRVYGPQSRSESPDRDQPYAANAWPCG
jgi:hypothetical protein